MTVTVNVSNPGSAAGEAGMGHYSRPQMTVVAALGDAGGPLTLEQLAGNRQPRGVQKTVNWLVSHGLVRPHPDNTAPVTEWVLTDDGRALFDRITARRQRRNRRTSA
ncbi:hypothetical protein ACFYTQ_26470 [Nocardia sp. NPDC004068]|uniref:hypothetical protein n=1 Tax=Nocardia sp. NPDC004068 TaxID=3364303 RepID=UPI003683F944